MDIISIDNETCAPKDAHLVALSLGKRWPDEAFTAWLSPKTGKWVISCDAGFDHYLEAQAFAQGFMASAHLWER